MNEHDYGCRFKQEHAQLERLDGNHYTFFCLYFYGDFPTYNDERLKHGELYKNYTEDYGYSK
uniref:Uncharacterized protein n=1 Tax=Romanomermis culicivorax TaxID=13658 RepID=A0A915IDQ7_ROMCU